MHPAIAEGIRLFNLHKYFEAHEALEAVWLQQQGDEKLFLHGLIQVAAAFHHHQRGNSEGFRSLLEKGVSKITRYARANPGIDVEDFLRQTEAWRVVGRARETGTPIPLPVVRPCGASFRSP